MPRISKLLLWATAALGAAAAIAAAGWAAERFSMQRKVDALHRAVEVHTLGLRGAAEKYDYLPFAAAQQPEVSALLKHPTDAEARARGNRYLDAVNTRAGSAALYVLDVQGQALAASNWQTPETFVGQNYRKRPYFQDSIAGQRSFFYGVGLTTGVPGLFIAAPVYEGKTVIGVVVVKVSLDALETSWARARDPVLLFDARGIALLSAVPDWRYRTRRPLGAADLQWLDEHAQYGGAQRRYDTLPWAIESQAVVRTRLDGQTRRQLALDQPLPALGWTLTVMADLAEVTQARNEAMALAALGLGVLLLGSLYWRLREAARRELEARVLARTQELEAAHAAQRHQEAQLQRAARLASVGEMASTLAHELNQPLMALSTFAVAARSFAEQGPPQLLLQSLDEVVAQAQRAGEIVRRVRGFVRQRSAARDACALPAIVSAVLAQLPSRAAVRVELPDDLPPVIGDRLLLEQLLLNLVLNALQASDAPQVDITAALADGKLTVSVADRGPGVPPALAAQLFEPFFSTKPEGLGMGLKICRSIAEAHGGSLQFSARDGGGTVFSFTLPT